MADSTKLPGLRSWPQMPPEWWRFFRELSAVADDSTAGTPDSPNVAGSLSIESTGTLAAGFVGLQLVNDAEAPGNTYYYGTGGSGAKGWYSLYSGLAEGGNIALSVRDDGVVSIRALAPDSSFPLVTGEVPPVLVYLDDGSLVYTGGEGLQPEPEVPETPLPPPPAPPPGPPPPALVLDNPDFELGATGWTGEAANTAVFSIINDPAEAYEGSWVGRIVGDLADAESQYVFNDARPVQAQAGSASIRVRFAPIGSLVLRAVEFRVIVQTLDSFGAVTSESASLAITTNTNNGSNEWYDLSVPSYILGGDIIRVGVKVRSLYALNSGTSTGPYTIYIDDARFSYGT